MRVGASAGPAQGLLLRSRPPAPQDLKPSNVAVNEDCELRVSRLQVRACRAAEGSSGEVLTSLLVALDPGLRASPPG